jgi:hypothetical protein
MKTGIFLLAIIVTFGLCSWNLYDKSDKTKAENNSSKKSSKRKSDVDFNFRLLNINGQESTTFKVGENFTFSLILENNSNDSLFLDNSFLTDGNGFCVVYSLDGKLVGQPFASSGAQIVSSDAHPFYGSQKEFTLNVPWSDSRPHWSVLHHNFKGLNKETLPKGKYYTVFKHRFCFDRKADKPSLCLQPVNVRIDFEVI